MFESRNVTITNHHLNFLLGVLGFKYLIPKGILLSKVDGWL
jgi:hypothetical protein